MKMIRIRFFTLLTLLCFVAGGAQAAVVQFENIDDSEPLWGFYIDGTVIDQNVLEIDVFGSLAAGVLPFSLETTDQDPVRSMFDTISFNITAPKGHYISEILYQESLYTTINVNDGDAWVIANGSISVNGDTRSLGSVSLAGVSIDTALGLGKTFTLSGQQVTTAAVVITNSILAGATGDGEAYIAKGYDSGGVLAPTLEVILEPIPLPAAALLFGSALLGFAAYSRGKRL